MHSPLEIAKNYVEIGIHKVRMSAWKMLVLGIFAGMFIGFAGIASTTAQATIENPAIARLIGACVFPAGTAGQILKNWVTVFTGNFLGAAFVALMVVYGHIPDLYNGLLAQKMVAAAVIRVNETFAEALIRGILCNILVCIAVWASFAAKKVSGKLMMSFWPVMIFVLCGFEHSIADMYFGMAGLLCAGEYSIAAPELTFASFILKNIIPVTLGNIIGGAGIVGAGYWAMYLKHTPGTDISIVKEQEEIDIAEEY